MFFQWPFISWIHRSLRTHKVINPCIRLALLFLFFTTLRPFITQHLNRPFDFLLLFCLLKLFNKVLRLTNFSFILINFILLIINLFIVILLVLKPFLFLLFFVSNHFCEVSKWYFRKCTFLLGDLCLFSLKLMLSHTLFLFHHRWCPFTIFFYVIKVLFLLLLYVLIEEQLFFVSFRFVRV